jgi:hypothetical protein
MGCSFLSIIMGKATQAPPIGELVTGPESPRSRDPQYERSEWRFRNLLHLPGTRRATKFLFITACGAVLGAGGCGRGRWVYLYLY